MLKRILVAVDGSDHAHKALEQALILAEDMKQPASLLIVHVNPAISINEPALGVDLEARIAEEGQHIIEPVTNQLSGRDIAYETLLIAGDPVNEICRVARERDCGMIVMDRRERHARRDDRGQCQSWRVKTCRMPRPDG